MLLRLCSQHYFVLVMNPVTFYNNSSLSWIFPTVCNIGKIKGRELYKQAKYTELRADIKRPYKVKETQQINAVFDFLADYNKTLEENPRHFTGRKQTAKKVIQQCQKWILSQNSQIVKYF